ncbi:MAG: hypothetical protein N2C14_32205, partial [Planctomycetales bacterium]
MQWLWNLKRDSRPKRITYSCEHPRDGQAYWLRIEEFGDPHRIARIEGAAHSDRLLVTTRNIRRFSIDLSAVPSDQPAKLSVDQSSVNIPRAFQGKRLTLVRHDEWRIASPNELHPPTRRAYGAGAAANLFQGEPLLVVYGTGADEAGNRFLKQPAEELARTGGPHFKPGKVQFSVKADTELNATLSSKFNLLLVGTPKNNSYLRGIVENLPYQIDEGVLRAGGRKPLPLEGSVFSFHHFNPRHADRAIYLVSPYLNQEEQQSFLKNPRRFLAGSDGFKMIDQPDLLVRSVDLRIRREMQLNMEWEFPPRDGEDQRVPDRFSDRTHLAAVYMKVMRRAADADFALWWGPADKGLFGGYDFNWLPTFDPEVYA